MKEFQSLLGMILMAINATALLQTQSVKAAYSVNEACKSTDVNCVADSKTQTYDLASDVGLGVLEPLPDNPDKCLKSYNDQPLNITDASTCMGYYYCSDKSGPGTWHKCPLGLHFHWSEKICLPAHDVDCFYDRCGNIDQTFVAQLGCISYFYCKNQTNQKDRGGSCKSVNASYPYFDEVLGGCVNRRPAFPICFIQPPPGK